ncbi:MAG: MerR family DNA-binding transcriptional regulator [Parachlamydiaceae bacterium]|nr:MerR family DNA-binding transcriptional regulator [Parachlamydiaceae bacterium]
MAYTVKKLSELSGVTIRTLHFYEEINLLNRHITVLMGTGITRKRSF